MATRIVLYQRLNKQGGYASLPVEYSRNGSPIADKNATAFYLRYRAGGKRHSVPAGANVLEADAQRKVLEARLATGMTIPTPTGMPPAPLTDRKVLIAQRMKKWCSIAKWHPLDRRCPPARARKNYWRLCARYPHVMQRLGLTELSVYE